MIGDPASSLSRGLQSLAPPGFLIGCRAIVRGDETTLLAVEAASITSRKIEARRGSAAARIVARELLAQLGISPPPALPKGPNGAPRWPNGIIGSLAHDDAIAVAVVGKAGAYINVGIDIERAGPLAEDAVDVVMTAAEQQAVRDPIQRRLLFAAKEATYKALNPIDGQFLEYSDIEVDLAGGVAMVRGSRIVQLRTCIYSHAVALALA